MKKKLFNKSIVYFLIFCLIILGFFWAKTINLSVRHEIFASSYSLNITDDLSDEVNNQLEMLDDGLEDILNDLGEREKSIFDEENFGEKLQKLISGNQSYNFAEIMTLIGSLLLDNISGLLPILALITEVAILSSLLLKLRGKSLNKPLGDIIHFACFAVVVVTVLTFVLQLVKLTSSTLASLKNQMEISFPILLTLMTALGASSSVSIYHKLYLPHSV